MNKTSDPVPRHPGEHRCFLLFSTTPSLLSWAIRRATSSTVSHACVAYECLTTGRVLVLEASGGGFRGITWERWLRENQLLHAFHINVPPTQWKEALGEFCDTLGTPYDTRRLALELARHLSGDWTQQFAWTNIQKNTRGVLCADAVAEFLYRAGFSIFKSFSDWTPESLLSQIRVNKRFIPMSTTVASSMPMEPKEKPTSTDNQSPDLRVVS